MKNESAFPIAIGGKQMNGQDDYIADGLTKREYFAALAMQAMLSDVEVQRWLQEDPRYRAGNSFKKVVAINSLEFADALITELNEPK